MVGLISNYLFFDYLENNYRTLSDYVHLENTKLIVDGPSISRKLFHPYPCMYARYEGFYEIYTEGLIKMFKELINCHVNLLVIVKGTWERSDEHEILHELEKNSEYTDNLHIRKKFRAYCEMMRDQIFLEVVNKLGIRILQCYFDAEKVISTVAKLLDCPILTYRSHFILYGNDCIFVSQNGSFLNSNISKAHVNLKEIQYKMCHPEKSSLNLPNIPKIRENSKQRKYQVYRSEKLLNKFDGEDNSTLILLLIMLKEKGFDRNLLLEYLHLKPVFRRDEFILSIDLILANLRRSRFEDAIREIFSLMEKKITIKDSEDIINRYSTMSTYMLDRLNDSSPFKIDKNTILKNKHKFFTCRIHSRAPYELVKGYYGHVMTCKVCYIDTVEAKTDDKKKIERMVPHWFITEYVKGNFSSSIINMIRHAIYIPSYYLNDHTSLSSHKISDPLIKLIYELVMSCTKVKIIHPLRLKYYSYNDIDKEDNSLDKKSDSELSKINYSIWSHPLRYILSFFNPFSQRQEPKNVTKQIQMNTREIGVDKYPLQLEEIRKQKDLGLKIIIEVVGIKNPEHLEDLPGNWRLYVVAAIFWMKRKVGPEKNRNHLNILLLTTLLNTVIKKVKTSCREKLIGSCYSFESLQTVEKFEKDFLINKNEFKNNESLMIKSMINICYQDAKIVFHYIHEDIRRHFPEYDYYDEEEPIENLDGLSHETMNVYSQFQHCLEHLRIINELLDFPYPRTDVSELFNETLLQFIHYDFTQQGDDIGDYVANKLKSASMVVKTFKMLMEKIDMFLE